MALFSLLVSDFEDGRPRVSPDGLGEQRRRRYWSIEWDWTGRFLLSPGVDSDDRSVIQVYDTQTGERHVLGADEWVQDVHLIRDVNAPILFDLTSLVKGLPVK